MKLFDWILCAVLCVLAYAGGYRIGSQRAAAHTLRGLTIVYEDPQPMIQAYPPQIAFRKLLDEVPSIEVTR